MNRKHAKNTVLVILFFVVAPLIQSCTPQYIGSIYEFSLATNLSEPGHIERGHLLEAAIRGTGPCGRIRFSWGDGSFDEVNNVTFQNSPVLTATHTYDYWGGPKTVTVEGVANCTGPRQRL